MRSVICNETLNLRKTTIEGFIKVTMKIVDWTVICYSYDIHYDIGKYDINGYIFMVLWENYLV